MEPVFVNYLAMEAPPDDQLRIKWDNVRKGFNVTLPVKLDSPDLAKANALVNHLITYKEEPEGKDYWQLPEETLTTKTGDCEDFAILKYKLLMPYYREEDMRIIVGNIKSLSVPSGHKPHAWLAVYYDGWKVLDSMFPQIITPGDYINWIPVAEIHASSVKLLGKAFKIADILPPVST